MVSSELQEALQKDIDELYLALGKEIYSIRRQALPLPIKRYIEAAKEWMADNKVKLKEKICTDKNVIDYLKNKKSKDRLILASAVLDLVASMAIGLTPVTVTALIINEGIETFCS